MIAAPKYHFLRLSTFVSFSLLADWGRTGTDVATLRGAMIELADRFGKRQRR